MSLSAQHQRWLAGGLIVAAYGNVIASIVGASFGVRGLTPTLPLSNLLVFLLFTLAIVGVFPGLGLAARGAQRWLQQRAASGPS